MVYVNEIVQRLKRVQVADKHVSKLDGMRLTRQLNSDQCPDDTGT